MAKFCAYCGTPLEEGAVCSCRQQAAPAQAETAATATPVQPQVAPQQVNQVPPVQPQYQQAQGMPYQQYAQPVAAKPAFDFNGFINTFIKTLAGIFTKPKTTAKEFVESKNFIAGLIMVGLNTFISAIFALIFFARMNSKLSVLLGIFGGSIKFPIFKIFAITFLFSLIISAAFFGLNALIGVMFKENYDVKSALCVTGIRSIVCVPITVLAIILSLMNPAVGVVCYFFGALVAAIYVQQALSVSLEKTAQYQVYINIVLCLVMLIVFYVLFRIGSGAYLPEGFNLANLMNMF